MFVYPSNDTSRAVNLDQVAIIRRSEAGNYIDFLDVNEKDIACWNYSTGDERDRAYIRLLEKINAIKINPNEVL